MDVVVPFNFLKSKRQYIIRPIRYNYYFTSELLRENIQQNKKEDMNILISTLSVKVNKQL